MGILFTAFNPLNMKFWFAVVLLVVLADVATLLPASGHDSEERDTHWQGDCVVYCGVGLDGSLGEDDQRWAESHYGGKAFCWYNFERVCSRRCGYKSIADCPEY